MSLQRPQRLIGDVDMTSVVKFSPHAKKTMSTELERVQAEHGRERTEDVREQADGKRDSAEDDRVVKEDARREAWASGSRRSPLFVATSSPVVLSNV